MRMNGLTASPSNSFAAIPGCLRSSAASAAQTVAPSTSTSDAFAVNVRSAPGMRIVGMSGSSLVTRAAGAACEPDDAWLAAGAKIVEHEDRSGGAAIPARKPDRQRRRDAADRAARRTEHAGDGTRIGRRRFLEQAAIAARAGRADHRGAAKAHGRAD